MTTSTNRRSRRITSNGTLTFRGGVPGGSFTYRDANEPFAIVGLWLVWMLKHGRRYSADRLEGES